MRATNRVAMRRVFAALTMMLLIASPSVAAPDPLAPLGFLVGTWAAATSGGSANATQTGSYTFARELNDHVLVRHSIAAGCTGPANYDCSHGDILYVYAEGADGALKAIYFDNEGHVIHYDVSTPAENAVVFLSPADPAKPQFRLTYTLKDGAMAGAFAVRPPGQIDWKPYLTWSGAKQAQ